MIPATARDWLPRYVAPYTTAVRRIASGPIARPINGWRMPRKTSSSAIADPATRVAAASPTANAASRSIDRNEGWSPPSTMPTGMLAAMSSPDHASRGTTPMPISRTSMSVSRAVEITAKSRGPAASASQKIGDSSGTGMVMLSTRSNGRRATAGRSRMPGSPMASGDRCAQPKWLNTTTRTAESISAVTIGLNGSATSAATATAR